jgi:hypothetical protein
MAERDRNKLAARSAVNVEVRLGKRPHPNTLQCVDCHHVWKPGDPRHEYDHHLGYAPEHWLDVVPVCRKCHARRGPKAQQTACAHGHAYTPENTKMRSNGTRECRTCRRQRESATRDAAWWRARRQRRAAS